MKLRVLSDKIDRAIVRMEFANTSGNTFGKMCFLTM